MSNRGAIMLTKDPTVFQRSKNPRELVDMARIYAASEDPADQAVVLQQLNSRDFLMRLNTETEYIALQPRALDVARIIKTLMDQAHPPAINTLINLTNAGMFQSFYPLVVLNILALAADRPASPHTIAYWDLHSQPASCAIEHVVKAIFANRSEPALRLFERKMNDPAHEDMRKSSWLRGHLLPWRNDPQVLQFSESMLAKNTLRANWHSPLLEALFDYNEGWYISESFPRPPNRLTAGPQAKELVGRIGKFALTQMQVLIPGLTAKIKFAMKEIGYDWDNHKVQA
jgi:hypothetical protein